VVPDESRATEEAGMRRGLLLIAGGVALCALAGFAIRRVPADSLGVLSWRGGGTPALASPGLVLRIPFLQTLRVYPHGQVTIKGEVTVSSREGTSIGLPYEVTLRPSTQQLLALEKEGGAAGARGAVSQKVEARLREAAAGLGTYALASGAERESLTTGLSRSLEQDLGMPTAIRILAPRLAPEVRASFAREAIYGQREETGLHVLLVGIDGADWDFIDPMIARGELPNLAQLKREGVWARMRSSVPTLSPLLWTSVATGKTPDQHGINDFLVADPRTGRSVPINSTFRRTKAIWTILTEAGLSSDIIAWWATWPAEAVRGHLISDRVAYSTFNVTSAAGRPGAVYPPDYAPVVSRLKVDEGSIPFDEMRRFVHIGEAEYHAALRAGRSKGTPDGAPGRGATGPATEGRESIRVLARVLAATRTYQGIALDLLKRRSRDRDSARLFAVYFQGVDEVNHRFAHCAPPRMPLCDAADYARFKDAVASFYRYQDRLLGELLREAPQATVILLSDHGFASGANRPPDVKPFIEGKPGLWHDLAGIFLARGPGIRRGEIPTVTLYDIAPTILYLLGLPVPDDMRGKVLEQAIAPDFLSAHPQKRVPSYEGIGPQAAGPGEAGAGPGGPPGAVVTGEADDEMLEQLRSLGYIGGATGDVQKTPTSPGVAESGEEAVPASSPAPRGVPTLLYHTNLGAVYAGKGQYDLAEAEFREALRLDPGSPQALSGMALLHEARGEPEKALDELRRLVGEGSVDDLATLTKMAELYIRMGRPEDGLAYMQALPPPRGTARGSDLGRRVALGMLQAASGHPGEAEKDLLEALKLDPASTIAMQELFTLYDGQGRTQEIEPRLRAALARKPRSAMHHNWLGLVYKRRGDMAGAEAEFRKTLEMAPDLVGAMANLASLYIQQNRPDEAVALLERAVEKDPRNVESRTNLIVALGMEHDLEGARRRVTEAEAMGQKVPLYYNALAYALYVNDRQEEALAALRQSLTLDPRQPDALRLRAEIESAPQAGGRSQR
jgi:tetratricopeptide (TPR) repeat protein